MKIVILDGYTENPSDLSWDELRKLDELTVYDRTSLTGEQEVIDRIGDAQVVITNKTPIPRRIMDCTLTNVSAWMNGAPVNVVNGL